MSTIVFQSTRYFQLFYKMYQGLILLQFLCIVLDYSFCLPADQLNVVHLCRCQSDDENCKLKLLCENAQKTNQWIGLTAFGFGWLENTDNCSSADSIAANSSFVLDPMKDNCSKTVSTYNSILASVSGFEQKEISNIFERCSSSPDYFIVHYFCVPFTANKSKNIIIGGPCQRNIPNTQSVSIYSNSFPHELINTTFPSCDCTLSTNASVLVVHTFDNRLDVNQTLALTHKNGKVIKQWKKPGNINEMLGNDTIAVTNSELRLQWNNKASKQVGKVWIVIEVANDAENITVVCDQNISPTSSSMTKTLTTAAATATTWLPNTTKEPSTSTADIRNSLNITKSLSTLTEMNISSMSPSPGTTHLTRSPSTSESNITHPTKALTAGISNITHTTKTLATSMAHPSEVRKNPTSNENISLGIIIGAVSAILLFLFILVLCLVIWCKKKKQQVDPTPSQPSNSKFKVHDARENLEDKSLHKQTNNTSPATNSSSVCGTELPPIPTGRYVNHVSTNDGLRSFNKNERSDEEENNETSNRPSYNTVIDNIIRNNTEKNACTGNVERKTTKYHASNKHETFEVQTGEDANHDNVKKKKRKKKNWLKKKKQNMIEALLDETKETQESYNFREGENSELSDV